MENIYNLNKRVSDLEYNSLKQRLDVLELSKQHWPSPKVIITTLQLSRIRTPIFGIKLTIVTLKLKNSIPQLILSTHKWVSESYTESTCKCITEPYTRSTRNWVPESYTRSKWKLVPESYTRSTSSNVNSYYNKLPSPQVNGYQNLIPDTYMRNVQPMPNVPFSDSHPPGQIPLKVNMPHMHNSNSHSYPWNLPPPCYMKTQATSGTSSDMETRFDQKPPTMECNASSMKNLVKGLPLHLNSILPNKLTTDPRSTNDAGCSNMVTQELNYATVETNVIAIHHEKTTLSDKETEHRHGLKSISNQPVISTSTLITAANIEPSSQDLMRNDNLSIQEEHFLGVTKPQKDHG
ncbi:unnamed protein product [Mytilus coruscus]|uniref:Uncharacterized protein n=1 Tax=Mytilus coruscus TaxID=42192 RepID=A0A6J7ZV81_MYTCO|nr:unnamed protein product [Mytilus coruscus]